MPAVQYPFIDIAVHPRIRERFARGEAMALFSAGLDRVLWANGAGADLFGYPAIYDFIEQGAKQGDVSFRQVASTAHQLTTVGDTRGFLIRIAAGFQRIVVNATVEMVRIQAGETAILFSCPVSSKELDTPARARQMLEGFDDPDTHMAVIGRDGEIIASSAGFKALGVTPQTAFMLVTMAGTQPERMIKRPIPTGQGYLPAAIGRLSDSPALHLLFVVEMIIGHLDPVDQVTPAPALEPAVVTPAADIMTADAAPLALAGVAAIEDLASENPAEIPNADIEGQISSPDTEEPFAGIPFEEMEALVSGIHDEEPITPATIHEIEPAAAGSEMPASDEAQFDLIETAVVEPSTETASDDVDHELQAAMDVDQREPTAPGSVSDGAPPAQMDFAGSHAQVAEDNSPEEAPAGMLDAISAANLPSEAAVSENSASNAVFAGDETEFQHEPRVSTSSSELVADMVAAIPADSLPVEAAVTAGPVGDGSNEHTDAHDLGPETVNYLDHPATSLPETASLEDMGPYWATSDIPAVTNAEFASFLGAAEEQLPETADHLHDEDASEMPAVRAADLAHYAEPAAGIFPDHSVSEQREEAAPFIDQATAESFEFATMIDAVANIEDFDDAPEDISDDAAQVSVEGDESIVAHDAHSTETAGELPISAGEIHLPPEAGVLAEQGSHGAAPARTEDSHTAEARERFARETTAFLASLSTHDEIEQVAIAPIEVPPAADAAHESEVPAAIKDVAAEQETHPVITDAESNTDGAEAIESTEVPLPVGTANADESSIDEPATHETPEGSAFVDAESDVAASETEHALADEAPVTTAESSIEPTADSAAAIEASEGQDNGFVFNRHGRATRFVWKIDAEGRFSEISREFADAVGPHAKSVTGVAFTDIAALFNLDPDGKIAELLARRDTWSGRTIHWPVEGTTLTVPVDLAALPTYTRSREFDGFRGFGVVRLSDAAEDPQKIGLTLTKDAATADVAEAAPSEVSDPSTDLADETTVSEETEAASDITGSVLDDAPEAEEPELPFNGEPPALKISETPTRRLSDKIIQLHQHRLNISDSLSPSEQAAFREIAKQLEPFGKRGEPPVDEVSDEAPISDEHDLVAENSDETTLPPLAANDDNKGAQEPSATEEVAKGDEEFDPLAVLSTAIPPRSKMTDGLSAAIVDQLPVAILIHAGDTLIHANPEFLRLTGYENLAEVEGIGGLDALLQRQDLQDKTERPGTMVLVRADDVLVPVTARLQSIRWEDSSALMLALMPVDKDGDITDAAARADMRDEARPERMLEKVAKLQVEVEELQSILETATDGVAIIGPEGDIRSMNRSASALFNYDEQETRGKPFVMLFAHESQKAVLDYLNGLTGNGVASVLNDGREVIGREASGGFVPLFMTMGVLTSSNGYCAVIRDITQWKRTEEELRNAKRAAETANAHKSDFLARVSHEIRTPLNAIIGFSDMMASERLGPIGHPRYVEYAGDIGRSGRHVLDIVNDLLDISKIEAGEMELEFGSVGLNAAIAEAVSIVQPQANGQRVIIRTALAQAVPNVVADLRSIKQIALNILSNAIRFTPSGGQIVVSTSYEGNGSVVLRIRDTGVGMTRTELEQAMKPFRQVATNSRQRGDGTGLGLPLTKAMVDANRALFAIHSSPNEGTLVEVTFPSQRVLAN